MSTARLIDQTAVKSGQVRVVSKNLPVHGQEASKAAEAAICASDQGKFWEYSDRLMESFYTGNRGVFSLSGMKGLAADLKLDSSAFTTCLDQGEYAQRVQDEAAEAQKRGVTGTPTFFVNDTKLVGAQPFEAFKTAIEAALKGK